MLINKIKTSVKFFLPGIFALVNCMVLHAEENNTACIYIADNAQIYGKELIVVNKQNTSSNKTKKVTKIKEKKPAPAETKITEQEPISVVFPTFPFEPLSSSFSQGGNEPAVVSQQQRIGGDEHTGKACRENTYPGIKNSDLSIYRPELRQKLSIAATQCGELTSFGAQSPPDSFI